MGRVAGVGKAGTGRQGQEGECVTGDKEMTLGSWAGEERTMESVPVPHNREEMEAQRP